MVWPASAIARLRVRDDLEDRAFDVNLDDVVQAIDDPNQSGKHGPPIIIPLGAAILDRRPCAAKLLA